MAVAKVVHKAAELSKVGEGEYEFVASDETPDRYGDVILASGWNLTNYKKNPIVLFGHDACNPVGIASKVWVDSVAKALMIRIKMAAQGTSPFIDTLRSLLDQKIIRAVSVGFMPTEDPVVMRDKDGNFKGFEYGGQELLENSLVSVPANPAALATAKSMNLPELHLQRVFAPRKPDASVHMALQAKQLEIIKFSSASRARSL